MRGGQEEGHEGRDVVKAGGKGSRAEYEFICGRVVQLVQEPERYWTHKSARHSLRLDQVCGEWAIPATAPALHGRSAAQYSTFHSTAQHLCQFRSAVF